MRTSPRVLFAEAGNRGVESEHCVAYTGAGMLEEAEKVMVGGAGWKKRVD